MLLHEESWLGSEDPCGIEWALLPAQWTGSTPHLAQNWVNRRRSSLWEDPKDIRGMLEITPALCLLMDAIARAKLGSEGTSAHSRLAFGPCPASTY